PRREKIWIGAGHELRSLACPQHRHGSLPPPDVGATEPFPERSQRRGFLRFSKTTPLFVSWIFWKELSGPSCALRKDQWRLPACGSSLFHLCRVFPNARFRSFYGAWHWRRFCWRPCCSGGGWISSLLAYFLLSPYR